MLSQHRYDGYADFSVPTLNASNASLGHVSSFIQVSPWAASSKGWYPHQPQTNTAEVSDGHIQIPPWHTLQFLSNRAIMLLLLPLQCLSHYLHRSRPRSSHQHNLLPGNSQFEGPCQSTELCISQTKSLMPGAVLCIRLAH